MSGWNGSSSAGQAAQPQKPVKKGGASVSLVKGIVCGIIVVVAAFAVGYLVLFCDKPSEQAQSEKRIGKIKQVKPAIAPRLSRFYPG